jgi:hypothetical protein
VAVRTSADEVTEKYGLWQGTLWFQGHWGFQYYMTRTTAKVMDFKALKQKPRDILVLPLKNTNLQPPDPQFSELGDVITVPVSGWLATWDADLGAGFYASSRGPLPFVLGRAKPEVVNLYYLKPLPGWPAAGTK